MTGGAAGFSPSFLVLVLHLGTASYLIQEHTQLIS